MGSMTWKRLPGSRSTSWPSLSNPDAPAVRAHDAVCHGQAQAAAPDTGTADGMKSHIFQHVELLKEALLLSAIDADAGIADDEVHHFEFGPGFNADLAAVRRVF
jgi:hypothetical protein